MVKAEASGSSAGPFPAGPGGAGFTLDLGQAVVGDLILCQINGVFLKGGVAGSIALRVRQNGGSATFVFGGTNANAYNEEPAIGAGATKSNAFTIIGKVTVAGTVLLLVQAESEGSDATGTLQARAYVVRGA